MRKLILIPAAVFLATAAAHADEQDKRNLGTLGGGVTGAIGGAVVGGPVGAVVGGVAGAVLGNATAVPEPVRTYVVEHPVESVQIQGGLQEDYVFDRSTTLHPVPDHPDFAYIYVDNRPVIVRAESRKVVYAAEVSRETTASVSTVPDTVVTYVERNRVDPIMIEGRVEVGSVIPGEVVVREIPESPTLGYVYLDSGPVVIERDSRRVIWVR